jgi:hypothetical protein
MAQTPVQVLHKVVGDVGSLEAFGRDQLWMLLVRQEGRFELPFKVSREEFEQWRPDKEDIGGFEYDSSLESIIIKADGGPLHAGTVSGLAFWFYSLVSEHTEFRASLGEGNFASHYFHMIINWLQNSILGVRQEK